MSWCNTRILLDPTATIYYAVVRYEERFLLCRIQPRRVGLGESVPLSAPVILDVDEYLAEFVSALSIYQKQLGPDLQKHGSRPDSYPVQFHNFGQVFVVLV